MPPPCSRSRSRRARSSGGRFSSSAPSARGSAITVVSPFVVSYSHRQVALSRPSRPLRNVTRVPSGEIWKVRGTPRVKRWVRACWRGKLIERLCLMRHARHLRSQTTPWGSRERNTGESGIVHQVTDRRLMMVHAHPDDESIVTGATLAKYSTEGVGVTLVTCTLGEEGEIIPPELAHLASDRDDRVGEYRIGELERACRALGVRDHRVLGGAGRYRDSGMMGDKSNAHPKAFWNTDVDEAAGLLAETIREVRPQVLVSYDEHGGYGHPDHIQAHRVSRRALDLAADRAVPGDPWKVDKLYAIAQPVGRIEESIARLAEDPGRFTPPEQVTDLARGTPDSQVTTRVDASEHWAAKALAMRAHATQITVDGPRFALSNGIG